MALSKKRAADTTDIKSTKKAKLQQTPSQPSRHPGSHQKSYINGNKQNKTEHQAEDPEDDNANAETAQSNQVHKKSTDGVLNGTSSREAHQKQKQLALERKAAKPNSDSIARTKKIWERLRIKSAVPKEERDKLVKELFGIITGRVKEFVFKHDSVRVIQCALKYANSEQKKQIANELKGSYRELAESKYAKFLVAKLVVGDDEVRDAVVPEFYGHVKRLMRHPEASWIVDDIYRGLASKDQKARLLREWYGPEFVLDAHANYNKGSNTKSEAKVTADLTEILRLSPEKRSPIMQHLKEMTNQLVQKKTTGFTMLHDALLQYFINTKPGSPEATEFLEMIKDDEEGDLIKNLAFTKSGSRIVCLALAYGNSKDRRTILKVFKTHIKLLSGDTHGHVVLLTAYEVIDDTVMTTKAIFPELLSKDLGDEEKWNEISSQVMHLTARAPLLYLMAPEPPKWLFTDESLAILREVKEIRAATSKKDPETRRMELVKAISQPLLDFIASQAAGLAGSSFGAQFITEVMIGGIGDKQAALDALAALATPETAEGQTLVTLPHTGRMFKALVQGGRFDKSSRSIKLVEPSLEFHNRLYTQLNSADAVISWATGPNSFAIVAMLEASDFDHKMELEALLQKNQELLQHPPSDATAANAGSKILLERIAVHAQLPSRTKLAGKGKKNR